MKHHLQNFACITVADLVDVPLSSRSNPTHECVLIFSMAQLLTRMRLPRRCWRGSQKRPSQSEVFQGQKSPPGGLHISPWKRARKTNAPHFRAFSESHSQVSAGPLKVVHKWPSVVSYDVHVIQDNGWKHHTGHSNIAYPDAWETATWARMTHWWLLPDGVSVQPLEL